MKNKQIVGLVVAGIVFVFVCTSSMLATQLTNKMSNPSMIDTLMEAGSTTNYDLPNESFVGVVDVVGTIMNSDSSSLFETATYDHEWTMGYIDAMMKSDSNKAILLNVDTPGGSVYDSDELYLKLMEYKQETDRPVWTYMANQACSGGYYVSMASDHIMANRNCWTGSIGVIVSLTNLKGLYDKLGIQEIDITSGANKSMGSSGLEMTAEQKAILQSLVDESYEQFVGIVASGRGMTVDQVKTIADGRIYSAKQALDLKLIDEVVDTYAMAEQKVKEEIGAIEFYTPEKDISDWTSLFSMFQKGTVKKSEVEIMTEFLENEGNGVPMYYAKP